MRKTLVLLASTLGLCANDYGSLLFHGNCVTCHQEDRAVSAPSMMEIKKVYKSAFSKKEDFITYMSRWVHKPTAKTSLMDGAIKKYKLMPLLGYDTSTLKEITTYIYDTDFAKK